MASLSHGGETLLLAGFMKEAQRRLLHLRGRGRRLVGRIFLLRRSRVFVVSVSPNDF